MKILHLYKDALPNSYGGIETFIFELARETSKLNCENVVLSTGASTQYINHHGSRVEYLRKNFTVLSTPISFEYFWKYKEIKNQFDIIHLHYPYPFADLTVLANFTNTPLIVSFHSEIVKQKISKILYNPIEYMTFRKAQALVFSSNNLLQRVTSEHKLVHKSHMIPLGLKSSSKPTKAVFSAKKDKRPYVLFVGVLRYYKGLDVLLNAAKHLEYDILVAGNGPLKKRLEKRKVDENISNVKFLGRVTEKQKDKLITNCRVLVLPSILPSEAFGLAILEAFALGKPVITCELGTGTSEIVDDGITGYVVKPNDHMSLAKKMTILLTNEPLAISFGNAAYSKFNSSFRIEDTARRYLALYERVKGQIS